MDQASQYIKADNRLDTEDSYPYDAEEGMSHLHEQDVGATDSEFVDVPKEDEDQLKDAVATVGPVSVDIDPSDQSIQPDKEGQDIHGDSSTDGCKPVVKVRMRCEVCQLTLNSPQQYNGHLQGKSHAKKLRLSLSTQPFANPNFAAALARGDNAAVYNALLYSQTETGGTSTTSPIVPQWATCPPAAHEDSGAHNNGSQALNSAAVAPMTSLTGQPKAASKRRGDLELSSDSQAEQHFKGPKRSKKWKGVKDLYEADSKSDMTGGPQFSDGTKTKPAHKGPVFYCAFCLTGVNSQDQLQQHRTGAKHKRLVDKCRRMSRRVSGGVGDEDQCTCTICGVSMDTHSQYKDHLESEDHILTAVKLGFPTEEKGVLEDFPPQPGSQMGMMDTAYD